MNSSLLDLPNTLPDLLLDELFSQQVDDSTQFQDAAGNLQATQQLFKNRFKVVRRLGRGGFSTTYLAQDTAALHPLPCVIKHLEYARHAKAIGTTIPTALAIERINRRFQKEARIMARLGRHPQLPRLLDHFADGDQFYLVQEHIAGQTLSEEVTQAFNHSGPQSEAQVKRFLQEMIPVIRYLHRHHLLHLDIKPANIIRRRSDQKLVLIDFGAVRRYPQEDADRAEKCSGTVGFSPAEQFAGKPTFASDIYALGVTCLYMLTATSPLDFAIADQGQNLRWQESVMISRHFKRILTKMLHPDATSRFQTIDDLARALALEVHYEDLNRCVTSEPYLGESIENPAACRLADHSQANSSQAQRQASSIRHWQQRRRQFTSFTPR